MVIGELRAEDGVLKAELLDKSYWMKAERALSTDPFDIAWRQVVFTGHDIFAGLCFEFQTGAFRNFPAGLRGDLVLRHTSGGSGFARWTVDGRRWTITCGR